jgi:hypothetical protein
MKRQTTNMPNSTFLVGIGVAILLFSSGCRTSHLGDEFGVRVRAALNAQTTLKPGEPEQTLDAMDARNIVTAHHVIPAATAPAAPSLLVGK